MVSPGGKERRSRQLAIFQDGLKEWIGAEVRVWYYSCTHDRLVLLLKRGEAVHRDFRFLTFARCDDITILCPKLFTHVMITDLQGTRWRLEATAISIDFYSCSLAELSVESLQEMSGLAPPILLDAAYYSLM